MIDKTGRTVSPRYYRPGKINAGRMPLVFTMRPACRQREIKGRALSLSDSTQILPPWASTSRLQTTSPSPSPLVCSAWVTRRLKGSKSSDCFSRGMPVPQSATEMVQVAVFLLYADGYLAAFRRILGGVLDEVIKDAFDTDGVGGDGRDAGRYYAPSKSARDNGRGPSPPHV